MVLTLREPILLLAILLACSAVDGYSGGAPTSQRVCAGMVPGHGADPQTGPMPYTIEAVPVRSNTALSVTILANTGQTFTGFMLQARNALNKNQILEGIFSEDKQSQIKSCNSNKANTLTHRSGIQKTKVESVWTPADSYMGEVVFRVTIVQTKDTYWVEHDSNVFRIRNGKVLENQKFLSNAEEVNNNDVNIDNSMREAGQSVPANSQKTTSNAILNYSVCDSKLCLGLGQTDNCVATKSCELLLSGGYFNKEEGLTEFELSALPKGDSHLNKYYSIAFSTDAKMGDDLVTDCYITSEGKVKIGSSYNDGKSNELNDEFKDSLNSIQNSYTNGVITCKWKSNRKRTVNGKEWDMLDKHHIFLAIGDLTDDTGTKSYHENLRLAANNPIALEQIGSVTVTDPIYLVRIHGVFMVIAWIGTVSLAIMFARYYKLTWVNSTVCGVKIWFAFHRGLMVTSVVLMIIAQVCIFTYLKEYRFGLHQILGTLAFTLALINPLGALLRPHPEASNRWVFNWAHWALGNAGHIIAIVAIFLSTSLSLADLPKQFLWTIISFVIFYVITHLILQFHTFLMQNRKTHDIALQDMSRGSDDPDMGTDGPGTGFRRFILGIYCIGVLAFVIAMVSLISLPKNTLEKMAIT